MNKELKAYFDSLQQMIVKTYEEGVGLDEAERLAARFLEAMMRVSEQLKIADLDSRMKKTGVKALKAAVYLEECGKVEKKPSDTYLQALVDRNELVAVEHDRFDEAEVERDDLQNYYNVFKEAHIYYRGISKGKFE